MFKRIRPEDAQKLLTASFPCPAGTSFYDDFPVWLHDESAEIYGSSEVIGGIRIANLKSPAFGSVRVALLGAIATDPLVRGKGLASQVTEHLLKVAKIKKASLAVLWGSEWSLYGRLGFEPSGIQERIPLSAFANLVGGASLEIREGWHDGIFDLMRSRSVGLELSPSDKKWVAAHRNTKWFWLGDAKGPKVYAAYGRGIDLGGLIHEWGFDSKDPSAEGHGLMTLFSGLNEILPQETEILGHPSVWPSPSWQDKVTKKEILCLIHRFSFPSENDELLWFWGLDSL